MIVQGVLQPMELAHLPYKEKKTYEDYLGLRGLKRVGRSKWEQRVYKIVADLRQALRVEYVVLGGGNSKKLKHVPDDIVLGSNQNAFLGGFRMWSEKPAVMQPHRAAGGPLKKSSSPRN
jgi:hypothetical protein